MTAQESVVTPERLAQGISWKQWMEQIDRNEEKFQFNYDDHKLDPNDVAAIKAAAEKAGGITCLAIGEAWCPDVVRGPILTVARTTSGTPAFCTFAPALIPLRSNSCQFFTSTRPRRRFGIRCLGTRSAVR